jgi:hypothetical protein
MYKFLSKIARAWLLIVLMVLFFGMFAFMQVFIRQIVSASSSGSLLVLPDAHFYYSPDRLISILDSFGPSGRLSFLHLHIVDTFFPLVYGLFLVLSMIYFWGKRGGAIKTASILTILPIAAALFDYAENICMRIVSALFDQGKTAADVVALHPLAASISGFATAAKWSFAALSILAVIGGIGFAIARRGRGSHRKA